MRCYYPEDPENKAEAEVRRICLEDIVFLRKADGSKRKGVFTLREPDDEEMGYFKNIFGEDFEAFTTKSKIGENLYGKKESDLINVETASGGTEAYMVEEIL